MGIAVEQKRVVTRRRILGMLVALLALFGVVPSTFCTFAAAPKQKAVRILVKVRPTLASNIEAAPPLTDMALVPGQSGNASVEAFLARRAVRKLAPLYPEIVRAKRKSGLSEFELTTRTRQKFGQRASRLRAAFAPPEISRTYVFEMDETLRDRLPGILQDLRADPDVEFAEEDKIVSTNLAPNDPYLSSFGSWGQPYDDLWGIKKIGAPAAWGTSTGAGVIVAIRRLLL
jgi:hypothetical protein